MRALLVFLCVSACTSEIGGRADKNDAPTDAPEQLGPLDYLDELATGEAQRTTLCGRGAQDRFASYYCNPAGAPAITGLESLLVGLALKDPANPAAMRFALTGHSTSLVARKTSSLNPRAILFSADDDADYTALGFVRGDNFAEVASFDPNANQLNFYLIRFHQACEPNCTNADKFLPTVEQNWQNVSAYNHQDVSNTALDCLQCHQPGGGATARILRMQELEDPWTHFFRDNRASAVLLNQFVAAHPGEAYAGIPANQISNSEPADLEDFVRAQGFGNQPNAYDGNDINNEDVNVTTPNPLWLGFYQAAVAGTAISPPHYMINPFDPAKVTSATSGYQAAVAGNAGAMPDMTALYRDSEKAYLGFTAAAGLDAIGLVQHRCGSCHDGRGGAELTKNKFLVANFPNNLTAEERETVLERLRLPVNDRKRMPPIAFSELAEAQIVAIESALAQ